MLPVTARKGEHRMLVTMMTSLSQESITRSLQLPCIFFLGVFTDKSNFSLNLPRTQTPHESTSTNQD